MPRRTSSTATWPRDAAPRSRLNAIWVSPVEVENALIEHPGVLECGLVGRCDHDRLVKPAAYVVLRENTHGTAELATELQQFVRTKLPECKRPRWVEFVPQLPKTATGKIHRFKLREAAEGALGVSGTRS